jgi:ABC-type Fe3+-siderophore transport system permease subunit
MLLFMGHSAVHTAFFAAAMLGVAVVLYAGLTRRPGLGAGAVAFTAAMMVGVREMMRISYLEGFYRAWDVPSRGEYSPLVLFLAALVLGVGVVAYVLKLARNAGKEA